jgi:hypothetical protein
MNLRTKWTIVAIVVAMAICLTWVWLGPQHDPSYNNALKTGLISKELVSPHLETAESRIQESFDEHLAPIRAMFNQSRSHQREFAKLALGWGSKWRLVADATPFTKGGRNEQFLKQKFEEKVLNGDELQKTIEQCVTAFLAQIRSVEGRMLVELQADIQNRSPKIALSKLNQEEMQILFDKTIERAMQVAGGDLQSNISSQLVSLVVGEVLTQVAVRLGVSAGILGTGAATSWATFGIGVVVGIIIDQIVMTIWNKWSDPEGKLVATLNVQLSLMERIICLGEGETKGLLQHFESIAAARSELRRKAVYEIYGLK